MKQVHDAKLFDSRLPYFVIPKIANYTKVFLPAG